MKTKTLAILLAGAALTVSALTIATPASLKPSFMKNLFGNDLPLDHSETTDPSSPDAAPNPTDEPTTDSSTTPDAQQPPINLPPVAADSPSPEATPNSTDEPTLGSPTTPDAQQQPIDASPVAAAAQGASSVVGNNANVEKRKAFVAAVMKEYKLVKHEDAEGSAGPQEINAKMGGGIDEADPKRREFRKGWDRLLEYFTVSYNGLGPSTYPEANVKYLKDKKGKPQELQDWCAIFALWALKSNGLVDNSVVWQRSFYKLADNTPEKNKARKEGKSPSVNGIRQVARKSVQVGDIGVLEFRRNDDGTYIKDVAGNPIRFSHAFIIAEVDSSGNITKTINGNGDRYGVSLGTGKEASSAPDSDISFYTVFDSP